MSIWTTLKNWWDTHPQIVGFLFALPIGMVVIMATFFEEDTGKESYALNYMYQQLAIIAALVLFVALASRSFISRKVAMVAMVILYAALQFIYVKFDITPS
jgi:hypothetical protein